MSIHGEICIVGGGIAGLAAALALAQIGTDVTVLEAADAPTEVGAGIQIPPNAAHVLAQLGVLDSVRKRAIVAQAVRLADARSGRLLLELDINGYMAARHGDTALPLMTIHRAALHGALYDAVAAHPNIDHVAAHRVHRINADGPVVSMTADTADGTAQVTSRIVIGADGVWSRVRMAIEGVQPARRTGRVALRALAPVSDRMEDDRSITAYLSADAHLVSYPVRNMATRNLVAIVNGRADLDDWTQQADRETVEGLCSRFSGTDLSSAMRACHWTVWPLAEVPSSNPWHNGRNVALIGDAAHAIEPFAAQGAAMALEDALALAKAFKQADFNAAKAFALYEKSRRARVAAVAKRTDFNRKIYHLSGLKAHARNLSMALRPASAFIKDLDWLYDHRI